jgi:hypothetical protein
MEDKELMAAIGQVVVGSAVLEYSVAVLVAMTDGHRDQDCENHALAMVKKTGRTMRELRKLADAHPERPGLMQLWRDARAVLDDRNVIAHSVALEDIEAGGHTGLVILHPRSGTETQLTTPEVLSHVQDIHIAYRRFRDAIAAESSADPSGA